MNISFRHKLMIQLGFILMICNYSLKASNLTPLVKKPEIASLLGEKQKPFIPAKQKHIPTQVKHAKAKTDLVKAFKFALLGSTMLLTGYGAYLESVRDMPNRANRPNRPNMPERSSHDIKNFEKDESYIDCTLNNEILKIFKLKGFNSSKIDSILKKCKQMSSISYNKFSDESAAQMNLRAEIFSSDDLDDITPRPIVLNSTDDHIASYANFINFKLSASNNTLIPSEKISKVYYTNDPSMDAGGVYREYFSKLMSEFSYDPENDQNSHISIYPFKKDSGSGIDQINPSYEGDLSLFGAIIANIFRYESTYDNPIIIDLNLHPYIVMGLMNQKIEDEDIIATWIYMDKSENKPSLRTKLEYFDAAYSYSEEELKEIKPLINTFVKGFHKVVPQKLFNKINMQTFKFMLMGSQNSSQEKFLSLLRCQNETIKIFFERYLKEELQSERSRKNFLRSITGSTSLRKYYISVSYDRGPDSYRRSDYYISTCSSELTINYNSYRGRYDKFKEILNDISKDPTAGFNYE